VAARARAGARVPSRAVVVWARTGALVGLLAVILAAGNAHAAGVDRVGAAAADRELTLLLGLRRDEAGLARFVSAVSDPGSARYRRFLDVPELARRFGASRETGRSVLSWLRARGMRGRVSATGAWVEATLTAGRAQRLFGARLGGFRSAAGDRFVAPVGRSRPPAALRGEVTELVGLDDRRVDSATARAAQALPPVEQNELELLARREGSSIRANTGTSRGCAAGRGAGTPLGSYTLPAYTPNQYLHAYRFDALHRHGWRGQGQRVAVIEIDGFLRSDVVTFGRCFGLRVPPTPITRVGIRRNLPPGDETVLDLEVLTAAAPGLEEIQVVETAGTDASLIKGYERVLARPRARRARVVSASLGECEPAYYRRKHAIRLYEHVFRMAAAAGISNLASTGDTGSTGCALAGNTGALALLAVQHPSASPHVTAVGGTNLELDRHNRVVEEIVWRDAPLSFGGGSGGYSVFFRRPAWQRGAGISGAERIVPDLAMLADPVPGYANYCTSEACRGRGWSSVGGTSAATPLLAGGIAIANQQARRVQRPPLGFLNPLIYRLARGGSRRPVFNDVLRTNNDIAAMLHPLGGGGRPLGCCAATKNHDAASGWGSISLPAFSRAARRLMNAGAR
jgi:subtilase family serine protease